MADIMSVRLGEEIEKDLARVEKKWKIDRSEIIRRLLVDAINNWKIDNAVNDLREGRISIGRAAKECGISIWQMIDIVKEKKIDWINYSEEDIKRDLEILK